MQFYIGNVLVENKLKYFEEKTDKTLIYRLCK